MSCGVGHRWGSDLVLLWLWCKLAAVLSIRPLAWEPPCAAGMALKSKKKEKKKENLFQTNWYQTISELIILIFLTKI